MSSAHPTRLKPSVAGNLQAALGLGQLDDDRLLTIEPGWTQLTITPSVTAIAIAVSGWRAFRTIPREGWLCVLIGSFPCLAEAVA